MISNAKMTWRSVNTNARRWLYLDSTRSGLGSEAPQAFDFTVPLTSPEQSRAGRVMFADMHTATGAPNSSYPAGCTGAALTAQDKALAFLLFQLGSCVGP